MGCRGNWLLLLQRYQCVAPDLRGFDDTDTPATPTAYTSLHIVSDLIGLLDAIAPSEEKVFVVGHGWGVIAAWCLCLHIVSDLIGLRRSMLG
ncbi:hypothetical protein K1719_008628 [Acacia pycnantha]|nr:hypothetical protein K1719_008628 [Acacia pycnantha]